MLSARLNPIQKKFYKFTKKFPLEVLILIHLDENGDVINQVSQLTKILSGQYESVFSIP